MNEGKMDNKEIVLEPVLKTERKKSVFSFSAAFLNYFSYFLHRSQLDHSKKFHLTGLSFLFLMTYINAAFSFIGNKNDSVVHAIELDVGWLMINLLAAFFICKAIQGVAKRIVSTIGVFLLLNLIINLILRKHGLIDADFFGYLTLPFNILTSGFVGQYFFNKHLKSESEQDEKLWNTREKMGAVIGVSLWVASFAVVLFFLLGMDYGQQKSKKAEIEEFTSIFVNSTKDSKVLVSVGMDCSYDSSEVHLRNYPARWAYSFDQRPFQFVNILYTCEDYYADFHTISEAYEAFVNTLHFSKDEAISFLKDVDTSYFHLETYRGSNGQKLALYVESDNAEKKQNNIVAKLIPLRDNSDADLPNPLNVSAGKKDSAQNLLGAMLNDDQQYFFEMGLVCNEVQGVQAPDSLDNKQTIEYLHNQLISKCSFSDNIFQKNYSYEELLAASEDFPEVIEEIKKDGISLFFYETKKSKMAYIYSYKR